GLRERLRLARARIAGEDFAASGSPPAASPAGGSAAPPVAPLAAVPSETDEPGIVVVGVSTGGPSTLEDILPLLPADFPWAVVVAQHMPVAFTATLARRLDEISAVRIVEATLPTAVEPGTVYIARGGADVELVRRGGRLVVTPVPPAPDALWHPNANRLMRSALRQLPASRLIGVLLTGMGNDGAETMAELHRQGGRTIAESEESAVVFGMPQALIQLGGAGVVLPSERIAGHMNRMVAAAAKRAG
ncbi:CheB methylesterase domain-containing protein, partial [Azospirillum doebereinerae]